jgi:hypothetical protein
MDLQRAGSARRGKDGTIGTPRISLQLLPACRTACVSARSPLLALPKATAKPGSSTLHSWLKM